MDGEVTSGDRLRAGSRIEECAVSRAYVSSTVVLNRSGDSL